MVKFVSTTGGGSSVDFETAILDGFASDGGLYVPEILPKIPVEQLARWKDLSYLDLAFEILSLFIDSSIVSESELRFLLKQAYAPFEKVDIIPLHPMTSRKDTYIMELFHGPTLSFKDVGLAFLVSLVNFFLERKKERLSLIVATTGDTGPAAAHFTAGKSSLDAWVLYPHGLITEAQERQMTTLQQANIHPVSVSNCADGGDDLDAVITKLFAKLDFKKKVKLSSVNSINWGRVMMQTVHYFYGYLQVVDAIGEKVHMIVPSGGFGNLCAGGLAREMGLPITTLVAANNKNACLHRIFSDGIFAKRPIVATASSAIDILIPVNFWRFLYFKLGQDAGRIKSFTSEFKKNGIVHFDAETKDAFSSAFLSHSVTDDETLAAIKSVYDAEGYVMDPHGAVAMATIEALKTVLGEGKIICLATAHPSKFPDIIKKALETDMLPISATHPSIERAKTQCEKVYRCDYSHLEPALIHAMETNWDLTHKPV